MGVTDKLKTYLTTAFNIFGPQKINTDDPNSVMGSIINAFTYQGVEIMGAIDVGLDRLDINYAVGEDLDAIADNYALERNEGTQAVGYVNLWAYSISEDVFIPKGTIVYSEDGNSFGTTQAAIILYDPLDYPATGEFIGLTASPSKNAYQRHYALMIKDGVTYDSTIALSEQVEATVEIPVASLEVGRAQNVDAHTIISADSNNLGGYNSVLDETDTGVDNSLPFSGGSDPETDTTFRARIKRHLSGTGTSTIKYIENASLVAGIDDARVIEATDEKARLTPRTGAVYVVVASARSQYDPRWAYEEANNNELMYPVDYPITPKEVVRNTLEDYRSVGVGVIVREAQVVRINFQNEQDSSGDMIVFVKSGTNLITYTQLIEARLNSFFQTYKIGQNVYKSDIVDVIRGIDAVVDVGPFNIVGDRWEQQTDSSYSYLEYSSRDNYVGEGSVRREGLMIYSEEIARPSSSYNFRLMFDSSSTN